MLGIGEPQFAGNFKNEGKIGEIRMADKLGQADEANLAVTQIFVLVVSGIKISLAIVNMEANDLIEKIEAGKFICQVVERRERTKVITGFKEMGGIESELQAMMVDFGK